MTRVSIFLTSVSWSYFPCSEKLQLLLVPFSFSPTNANSIQSMIESLMTTQQKRALETSLQHIEDVGEVHRTPVPWYIFTNDSGYGDLFPYVGEIVEQQQHTGKLRVSLLSGTGGLLSLAPELSSVDLFLIFDNNRFVPESMIQAVQTLRGSLTEGDFLQKLATIPVVQELIEHNNDPWEWFEIEKNALGEHHFLSSPERFCQSKITLSGKPVIQSIGNFTHPEYVDSLAEALQKNGAEIAHAHFTDVTDWHPEILTTISSLPFREDAAITWSTNQGRPNESPLAQLSIGLENYIQDASVKHTPTNYFKRYEQ